MTQRVERVANEIREAVGEILVRGEIKDPRVRQAGIITITHVRLSADLRQARVFFIVHDAGPEQLDRVREGLESAAGFLRRAVAERLRLKSFLTFKFEVDRVFEQEERVDALLRDLDKPS